MAIYEGSRYTNVYTHNEEYKGKQVYAFNIRELPRFHFENSIIHTVIEGERLDILANRYYKDPQLWWVILDANPHFMGEWEIVSGTFLTIPSFEEVRKVIQIDS